jgi:adenine-specific DNA methylase
MFDINEKEKRVLASWVLQNLADLQFSSIYDPFSGNAKFGTYFKKMGYQVITSDILQCNYWWNKAVIDNKDTRISEQTKKSVLNLDSTVTSIFADWTDSFFTAEECRQLEVWNSNINSLAIADEEKALLYVAVYLTMDYWITYNKRYFQTKFMNPNTVMSYYMDLVNKFVFDNGMPNVSYYYDSYDIASQIPTEVVYIYPPSRDGFRNYNMRFYLWECWTRRVNQLNLEGVIAKADHPKLGETFSDASSYTAALDAFLSKIKENPIWVISYNGQISPGKEMLIEIIKNYKNIHKEVEIDIPYPTAAGTSMVREGIIIAVS